MFPAGMLPKKPGLGRRYSLRWTFVLCAGKGRRAVDLHHHVITSASFEQGRLLSAVGPLGPEGDVALYFKSGFPVAQLVSNAQFEIKTQRSIANGIQIIGTAKIVDGLVVLPILGETILANIDTPQPDLFEGLNTGLAMRLVETPETIADWLGFHARNHGLQAALIVDRAPPDQGAKLLKALQGTQVEGIQRVVVVSFDVPLGREDLGDETLPYFAPDVPGRDRLPVPEPAPWRAPFSEVVVYELLRHRYLSAARGVMNVDLSDLVAPIHGSTVFDRATAQPAGGLTLTGNRIYPWGLKKGATARFSDHICRRFDAIAANPRWCLSLDKQPGDTVWRMIRVVGAQPGTQEILPYLRCMVLRHPTDKMSNIVPKTSLIEDDGLRTLMAAEFGGNPQRAPAETLKPAAARSTNRTGIITTMKNEGPFILEWLAYHKAIGVEDFLVYTNDCTDGTETLLKLLQTKGIVQHRDNPFRSMNMKPQHGALHAADSEPMIHELDWVVCMDVDEFINIHVGNGRLEDLYNATGDANMISMTWRLFGNGDVEQFRDGFITEEYIRCAPELVRKPHQAWGFKTLTRNTGIFKKLGVHRPKGLRPQLVDQIRWVNGSGNPMPMKDYRNAWRSTSSTYGYDLVTLNHYALRSAESFLVKRDRGRVNHVDRDQGLNYWFRMNHNAEEDRSIQRMIPAARAEFAKFLADPEIEAAHSACVTAHRAKIRELMATEKYAAFYADITGDRLRSLSRMLDCFGANVFLSGPDVIPDEVLAHAGEKNFFFTVNEVAEAK